MIRVERGARRWTVTIDRADKANALTGAMLEDLVAVMAEARQADPAVLVLTGAGERVFSAGADLAQAQDGPVLTRSPLWGGLSDAIAGLNSLTIARLNGTLAGGAFGMALACDLRVCTATARFFYPVLERGFLPQPNDLPRLIALVGPARAKLILMGGQKIDADTALAMGLVDRVAGDDGLDAAVDTLAATAEAADDTARLGLKAMFLQPGDAATSADAFAALYGGDTAARARLQG